MKWKNNCKKYIDTISSNVNSNYNMIFNDDEKVEIDKKFKDWYEFL